MGDHELRAWASALPWERTEKALLTGRQRCGWSSVENPDMRPQRGVQEEEEVHTRARSALSKQRIVTARQSARPPPTQRARFRAPFSLPPLPSRTSIRVGQSHRRANGSGREHENVETVNTWHFLGHVGSPLEQSQGVRSRGSTTGNGQRPSLSRCRTRPGVGSSRPLPSLTWPRVLVARRS